MRNPEVQLKARWTRFVQAYGPTAEEQLLLRDQGIAARIERDEADGELEALRTLVKLRRPSRSTSSVFGAMSRPSRESVLKGAGTAAEREHAKAIANRIANLANNDDAVLGFRSAFGIPRKGLSGVQARALLTSPLLTYAMRSDLDGWGIPVSGHHAVVISRSKDGEHEIVEIRVGWDGGERQVKYGCLPDPEPYFIEYPSEKGRRMAVRTQFFSLLGDLKRAAETLSLRAPFNALTHSSVDVGPACVWLIVTGQAMPLLPIRTTCEIPGSVDSITVTYLPRVVSQSSLIAACTQMQRRVLGRKKGRAFEPRNMRLVLFIEERTGGPVSALPPELARKMWREWNAKHAKRPRWAFSDSWDMIRAYLRTKEAYFPDPMGSIEAIERGQLTHAMQMLVAVDRELAARSGAQWSPRAQARELVQVLHGAPDVTPDDALGGSGSRKRGTRKHR